MAVAILALTAVVTLALAAFTWPAARLAPRSVDLGVVATGPAAAAAAATAVSGALAGSGAFDVHRYADTAAARTAIEHREVAGAVVLAPGGVTVLTASAGSPALAQVITQVGDEVAARVAPGRPAQVQDVVPTSPTDPHGAVLASAVLPLVLCGELLAVVVVLLLGSASAGRQIVVLITAAAVIGTAAYLIAQTWLGALPGLPWATWSALGLMVLAISATTAGLYGLVGVKGLGAGAALMVFLGNPFSGVTSAPDLLPAPAGAIGRWLPPGAGVDLVRSTAYFDGHGATGSLVVLLAWAVGGLLAVTVGHGLRRRPESAAPAPVAGPATAGSGRHEADEAEPVITAGAPTA